MSKKASLALVITLFLSLAVTIRPVASGATVVRVNPALIEYHENATGQQFTINVTIADVTNLYGFDLKFTWNTTYLNYVSRSVLVPRNGTSPDGVLWDPFFWIEDVVYANGTYWIACASRYPAPSFNGSGTVFTMTFAITYHPVLPEPDANIVLDLNSTDLAGLGGPIPHATQDGTVLLHALPGASHDVAVTDIKSSKTGCVPMPVVGQNYTVPVNVTVANQGDVQETFNVTTYANQTMIGSQRITLGSGAAQVVTFNWNTSGYVMGNYTLSAVADTVPGETPDDAADNTFNDGVIYVGIPGDVDGNHKVEIKDILIVAKAYGANPQSPNWNPNPDVDCNDKVEIKDILITAKNYGKSCSP